MNIIEWIILVQSSNDMKTSPSAVTMSVHQRPDALPPAVCSIRLTSSEKGPALVLFDYAGCKARELAGMSLWTFRQLLAFRRIPPHYDEADLQEDLATLTDTTSGINNRLE